MYHQIFQCPICYNALSSTEHTFRCRFGHAFDIAKEGYINLLLCNKKKTKNPGDNKESVVARENFLASNLFDPLLNYVNEFINRYCSDNDYILDAGCGTGYYLRNVSNFYNKIGVDISKEAIRIASKKDGASLYIVASIFDMPFVNGSFNCILNIFAPKPNNEFIRLLSKGGIIIEVIPGTKHLYELKKLIYDDPTLNRDKVKSFDADLLEEKHLQYQQKVNSIQASNLFSMTPFFFRTKKEDLLKLNLIEEQNITFDFVIKIWRKQ